MDPKLLGRRIRTARFLAGEMSREELGEKIGYSAVQIGRWERGDGMPREAILNEIARATRQPRIYFSEDYEAVLAAAASLFRKGEQDR